MQQKFPENSSPKFGQENREKIQNQSIFLPVALAQV